MDLNFSKSTDSEHKVKIDPILVSAFWSSVKAPAGGKAKFKIQTAFVGNNAPVKVSGKSENGVNLGTINGKIQNNLFRGKFDIPEDMEIGDQVYYEVSFPKNGLDGESERIPVVPIVRVNNMRWSASEARRGDRLTLTAFVDGVRDNEELVVTIYEYDRDDVHDKITELSTIVNDGRIEIEWEYQYYEDTDEIPTQEELNEYGGSYNPPEYFFTVKVEDEEFGLNQESEILKFKDNIEIEVIDENDEPLSNANYTIILADGIQKTGTLDENGSVLLEDIPPGKYEVSFPSLDKQGGKP